MYKTWLLALFATVPSSTNFTLNAYEFGNGSGAPSSSSYQLQASAGQTSGNSTSSSYALPSGVRASTTVRTPATPTFTNPDSSYNRLKVVLNTGGAPSDTTFLIAISDDNFTTTKYVQLDQTISTSVSIANYQTYAAWGGASGFWVLGLNKSTTYKIKVAALQGNGTGSSFGPTASASTAAPTVTFAVSTSLTATPPFSTIFSSLSPGSTITGSATLIADITTNAQQGGSILIRDQNSGLTSTITAYTLSSSTGDLTTLSKGYGAQISGASQVSGGPITSLSPFNAASGNVGGLSAVWQQLATFSSPITSGNVTTMLKAKSDTAVPAASDFSDTVTIAASLVF
jgi:hypothetical protein